MCRLAWIGVLLGTLASGCGRELHAVPFTTQEWVVLGGGSGRTWQGADLLLDMQPQIAWTRNVAAPSETLDWAVADGERIYVTGHDSESKRFSIKAIRLSDGEPAWQLEGNMGGELALAGGRLFQVANEGAQAFDAASGVVLWRQSPGWKYAEGLLADSERLYVVGRNSASEPTVYAMAAGDGQGQWTCVLPFLKTYGHAFAMRPGLLLVGVEKYLDLGTRGAVVCLRPEDGCRLWELEPPGVAGLGSVPPESLGGMTLTSEGLLVLAAWKYYWWKSYDQLMVYDLSTEKLLWKMRLRFTAEITSVTEGGIASDGARAFVSTADRGGEVRCLDLRTGWPLWQSTFNTKGAVIGHPVVSGNVVLVVNAEGEVLGLAAKNGRLMWKIGLRPHHAPTYASNLWGRMLVAGGRLIVFDDHTVWTIKAIVRPSAPSGE